MDVKERFEAAGGDKIEKLRDYGTIFTCRKTIKKSNEWKVLERAYSPQQGEEDDRLSGRGNSKKT